MLDKNRIKICSHQLLDFLLDNPCSKGVATAYLEDAIHPCKHLSHEFVARKQETEPLGIISPDLAAHQPKGSESLLLLELKEKLVLPFSGLLCQFSLTG